MLEPVWSCGAALPNSLIDLQDTGDREEEEEEEEEIEAETGGGKRGRTSLTLTILDKAMANDDLTLIV